MQGLKAPKKYIASVERMLRMHPTQRPPASVLLFDKWLDDGLLILPGSIVAKSTANCTDTDQALKVTTPRDTHVTITLTTRRLRRPRSFRGAANVLIQPEIF